MTNAALDDSGNTVPDHAVSVFDWTVPRPTGRWHQAVVVTSRHVWVTPELAFSAHEQLLAAAAAGLSDFHDHVRTAGWVQRPPRCDIADVRGMKWDRVTGWLRIAGKDDHVIGAQIPDRTSGDRLEPLIKRAIAQRARPKTTPSPDLTR